MKIIYRFTNACNYGCRHCVFESSENGRTASFEESVAVLNHLPRYFNRFTISGGEPLFKKDEFYRILRYISRNRERLFPPEADLWVLTNGFWLKDPVETYDVIRDLHKFGVGSISITGFSKYHIERASAVQGWDCKSVLPYPSKSIRVKTALDRLAKESGLQDLIEVYDGSSGSIMPAALGRARNLPSDVIREESSCEVRLSDNSLSIDPYGNVHICCWEVPPAIGSALETSIDRIQEQTMDNGVWGALRKNGPRGAAKVLGKSDLKTNPANECVMCAELFWKY